MSTQSTQIDTRLFGRNVAYEIDGPWASYWLVLLRVIAGWWLLGAGLSKVVEQGLVYDTQGWLLYGTEGTIIYPITEWFAMNAVIVPNVMVPWGQIAIGLGLILGCLTRLAAANGAILLFFFYFGGAGWTHGFVTGELLGILVYLTIIIYGAGRVWGIDAVLERTRFVRNRPWMRYLMG